jgi:hypothetical protein
LVHFIWTSKRNEQPGDSSFFVNILSGPPGQKTNRKGKKIPAGNRAGIIFNRRR